MIKYIMLFLITILLGCNNNNHRHIKVESNCQINHQKQLTIETLEDSLLGMWNYRYSFKKDTCFQIADLGDLSPSFEFKITNKDSIQAANTLFYSFAKEKQLFGLVSLHESKPFGPTSYPLVNLVYKDSSIVRITHYTGVNSLGKSYSYFLESVANDTLLIFNERNYHIGKRKFTGVRHIYLKTKKQNN